MQDKRKKHEETHANLQNTIKSLKIYIPNMFDRIGCNSAEYTQGLNEEDRVIKKNLCKFNQFES